MPRPPRRDRRPKVQRAPLEASFCDPTSNCPSSFPNDPDSAPSGGEGRMEANPASVRPAVPNCAPDPTPQGPMPRKYLARVDKLRGLMLVALPLLLAGCGKHTAPQRVDTRVHPAPAIVGGGRLVDVGGHKLYLTCEGSGSPTVVLEARFGGSSGDWGDTQRDL